MLPSVDRGAIDKPTVPVVPDQDLVRLLPTGGVNPRDLGQQHRLFLLRTLGH